MTAGQRVGVMLAEQAGDKRRDPPDWGAVKRVLLALAAAWLVVAGR